jgi:ComF family protein
LISSNSPRISHRRLVFSSGDLSVAQRGPHRARFSRHGAEIALRTAAESLFSILFPSDCRICQSRLTNISNLSVCKACLLQIPLDGTLCCICGEKIIGYHLTTNGKPLCGSCRLAPPRFNKGVALGAYQGVRSAAPRLLRFLGEAVPRIQAPDRLLVVPVPLWPCKRRARGFNQAEDIARGFCRSGLSKGIQLGTTLLVRTRETASQTGLTRRQRHLNLRRTFWVVKPEQVQRKNVLLIDDVMTRGATAVECARVLLRAGARQADVRTVAPATRETEGVRRVLELETSALIDSGMKIKPSGGLPGHA